MKDALKCRGMRMPEGRTASLDRWILSLLRFDHLQRNVLVPCCCKPFRSRRPEAVWGVQYIPFREMAHAPRGTHMNACTVMRLCQDPQS
jgi:hypothetical protein